MFCANLGISFGASFASYARPTREVALAKLVVSANVGTNSVAKEA
jgi:hypothetical protein